MGTLDDKQIYSNNAVFQHPNFSKPPASFLFVGRWFRFGLVLFLLLSVLLGTSGCSAKATNPWSAATSVVPLETVQAVVAENSELNPQEAASNVLAWTVDGQAGRLVVFNFNNPGVCGSVGCLYAAYLVNKDTPPVRVFYSYLNPNLPPNRPLFQVADELSSNSQLPCLQVQQPSGKDIRQLLFCFNGSKYQLAKSYLIEIPIN
ncbi:MAG TPA: hypothetical protein DCZ55_08185 [Cyanobacteria bacterium UBA11371]|nr:hypothetical protein [Cyanobacteria bacterium UBA11371]HBE35628.1 hypothetical protein [Cyanobacteria bacterium UBA11368]